MLGLTTHNVAVMEPVLERADSDPFGARTAIAVGALGTGIEDVSCWMYEPDGTLLSAGRVQAWRPSTTCRVLVVELGWPGRIVQRCLVGDVRDVELELEWGACLPARIERVRFDPIFGRTCQLHLSSVCRASCAQDRLRNPDAAARPEPQRAGPTDRSESEASATGGCACLRL